MVEVGLRSGKVRAGKYLYGRFVIIRHDGEWEVRERASSGLPVASFKKHADAYSWARTHSAQ